MHTVAETAAFLRSADAASMTETERKLAVDTIAANPRAGDLIVGSGGCRKVRVAGRGFGKSGGYRVITFYAGERAPVYLLWALSKGQRANLTDAQVSTLAKLTRGLRQALRAPTPE
ncbi:MAG TPA: type II toxin-antitoxin system RelE/ParE family toxin [Caulobacteraceae bacterium]